MNSLFQTALLLSADPDVAEHNIAASFENIDFSQAPGTDAFGALQESVVTKSILGGCAVPSAGGTSSCELLQQSLWPILQIEGLPRKCFVLRMLLGYGFSSCAQMLGIQDNDVRALLRIAILQLQQAFVAESSGQQPFIER